MRCFAVASALLCLVTVACSGDDRRSGASGGGSPDGGFRTRIEDGRLAGIVEAHNQVRARVAALPPLAWDAELAAIAQEWSEHLASSGCGLMHSGRAGVGENLASFSGGATAETIVEAWASEDRCYTFGPFMRGDACDLACLGGLSNGCGHYTQIVWRSTERVGCGVATCPSGQSIWTCNYDPPGNYIGQEPY